MDSINSKEIQHALKRPFPAQHISWRVGAMTKDKSKGVALAYIDARDVMRRFDDVFGLNWANRYTHAEGKTICEIGVKIDSEWVWRAGGAGDTDIEAEKGAISDAFKRAAVLWGVGRYLYELPNEWMEVDEYKRLKRQPTLPAWATPEGFDALMARKDAAATTPAPAPEPAPEDEPPETKPGPFIMDHWIDALSKCGTADELMDFKTRGMAAAELAKNESGFRAIRTEANRLAKLKGWA